MGKLVTEKNSRPSSPDIENFVQEKGKILIQGVTTYCQQTSLHGWQYIVSEQGFMPKMYWLIIVLMSLALSVIYLVDNTKAYLKSTTVTSIDSTTAPLRDILFPSVYICNVNQVTKSFLRNLEVHNDDNAANLLFSNFLTGSKKSELNFENQTLMDGMINKMKEIYNWNNQTLFYNISSQICSNMIIGVSWKSNPNYSDVFLDAFKSSTDYGACCLIMPYLDLENPLTKYLSPADYTGKDYHSIPKGLTRNGIQNGLSVMIDVESYEYAYFERGAEGFRVAIEDCRDKPVINQNGFYVSPGSETLLAIMPTILNTSQEAMDRFTPEERNCYADEEFRFKYLKYEYGFRYSMLNCLYESVLEQILKDCSCIPNFANFGLDDTDDIDVCRGKELDCAIDKMNNFGNEEMHLTEAINTQNNNISMICRERCEMQDQDLSSTQSDYPNWQTFTARKDFCLIFKKVVKVCENPIQKLALEETYKGEITCNQITELSDGNQQLCQRNEILPDASVLKENPYNIIGFLYKYMKKNIAVLQIFIRDPYYTLTKKDEHMPTVSWIGNTGGLVGLFMGLSFVSVFEMLYHGFNFLLRCLRLKYL